MLGENILRLRKEANLSQEALGDIVGVTDRRSPIGNLKKQLQILNN